MLSGFWALISFGKAEVNQKDNLILFSLTNTNIFGFHIPVYKLFSMKTLKSYQYLVSYVTYGFIGEVSAAKVEQLLKVRP